MAVNKAPDKQGERATLIATLQDKKFLAFLDRDPNKDTFDPNDLESAKKKVEVFRLKEAVVSGLKKIYGEKIKDDLGIELGDADFASVDDFLTDTVILNQKFLEVLAKKIKDFNELPARIEAEKRYVYSQISTPEDMARLKEKEDSLYRASKDNEERGVMGRVLRNVPWDYLDKLLWVGKYLKIQDRLKTEAEVFIKEKYGVKSEDAGEEVKKVWIALGKLDSAKVNRRQMEAELQKIRTELFDTSLVPALMVAEITKRKLRDTLQQTTTTGTDASVFDIKSKISEAAQSKDFGFNKDPALSQTVTKLEAFIERQALHELARAIKEAMLPNEASPMNKLEQIVKPFLEGSPESRKFILDKVKYALGKLAPGDPMALLLKTFLFRIGIEDFHKDPNNMTQREKIERAFA